jgi:hypothetical protein
MKFEKEKEISCDLRDYDAETQRAFSVPNIFINDETKFLLIKTIVALCPKLVLAGSISLHVLGIKSIDFQTRKPDLDFGLTEPLTEDELDGIIGFLNLKPSNDDYFDLFNDEAAPPTTKQMLKKDIIRLFDEKNQIFIDIFNSNYDNQFHPKRNNLYPVNFQMGEELQIIYVQSPAVTISHKMKYSFYPTYNKRKKHKDDCVDFLCKNYVNICTRIQGMDDLKKMFTDALSVKFKENLSDIKYKIQDHKLSATNSFN